MASRVDVHKHLTKFGSFPKGERPDPYQEYYWDGKWIDGQRSVRERASIMQYKPQRNESVLELGCQMGGFLQLAALAGATWIEGVEIDTDYIRCANMLLAPLTTMRQHVQIVQGDISLERTLKSAKQRAPLVIDHLIVTSLGKHIGGAATVTLIMRVFRNAKRIYFETNAVPENGAYLEEERAIEHVGGVHIGDTKDRNFRRVWLVTRQP